ncbi:hypothetical protein [Pseudomonas sp. R5(2019)]|uniref:hypothetical protein n=1 Tax=Pseudomonas sp. R5(2019) TaxID=2697566 RepID=UPI0015B583D9|nr:hypothetical protein [Pseudomonas sp. R5(2019)]
MLTHLPKFALVALLLSLSGCYHHHYDDRDDGWRDRDHRHSRDYDRDDRDDRRDRDRDRDDRRYYR